MKKKNAFTLVELLAVLVVLGIIAAIIIPSVSNQIHKNREKLCVVQYENILNAARSYGAEHISELGTEKTITLSTLINNGYIEGDKLKDPIRKKEISHDLKIKIAKSGKKYQYFIVDNGQIGCFEKLNNTYIKPPEENNYTGIPSNNYNVGTKVSYLGYNWYVMKDNGDNDLLIMDGYLSNDELKANLPSDVDSSQVISSGMGLCLYGEASKITETKFLNTVGNYCYHFSNNLSDTPDKSRNYSWKTSVVKPTLENWLNKKMAANNLSIDKELKGMAFNDGKENNTGYIRLIQSSEFSLDKTSTSGTCVYGIYCPINEEYAIRNYRYWTMTSKDSDYVFINNEMDSNYTSYGDMPSHSGYIVPVINVNEK